MSSLARYLLYAHDFSLLADVNLPLSELLHVFRVRPLLLSQLLRCCLIPAKASHNWLKNACYTLAKCY